MSDVRLCQRCNQVVEVAKRGHLKPHHGPFGPCLDKVRCPSCAEVVWVREDGTIKGHLVYVTQAGRTETCPAVGTPGRAP